jgi:D-amino-acid dehydrogenase
MYRSGVLFVFETEAYLHRMLEEMRPLEQLGMAAPRALSPAEVRALEPAVTNNVAGGVLSEDDRHVRPESLMPALVGRLRALGVGLRPETRVIGFERSGAAVRSCATTDGPQHADAFLIAAGAWSSGLLDQVGWHLPLQAGKGYSITYDRPPLRLSRALYLSESRVAVSPFEGALRFAGTMELSGVNTDVDRRRIAAIDRVIDRFFPPLASASGRAEWVGMRPVTPDGLPVIGRVPGLDNLYVATGHAMLGISLAPATAALLAALIVDGVEHQHLAPFEPSRFGHPRVTRGWPAGEAASHAE